MQFSSALQSAIERTLSQPNPPLSHVQLAKANDMAQSVERLLTDSALKRVSLYAVF